MNGKKVKEFINISYLVVTLTKEDFSYSLKNAFYSIYGKDIIFEKQTQKMQYELNK